MAEADLYAPIKTFLERQGYEVKGEVEDCDVVAVRGDEPPLVVELKLQLNLSLILQAVDRLAVSDCVYVAFRVGKKHSASWRSRGKQVTSLLRRLGLGLLTVSARGRVEAVLDPGPYRPRVVKQRRERLLREFAERVGDPVAGGGAEGVLLNNGIHGSTSLPVRHPALGHGGDAFLEILGLAQLVLDHQFVIRRLAHSVGEALAHGGAGLDDTKG